MAANTVFLINTFADLKQKSSGGGGFSDGGVLNRSIALKEAGQSPVVVEIAPPKGVVYGGVQLGSTETLPAPQGVSVTNFDPTNYAKVQEFFVQEDGTEVPIEPGGGVLIDPSFIKGVSLFFFSNGRLQWPNKLRYQMVPSGKGPTPAGRVLLKYTLKQYDRPADQTF